MTNKKLPNSDLSPAEIYRKYADIVSESMNDRLRYTHSKGKQYSGGVDDSGLPGTAYDPDTGDMHVRNTSSLGATHQELEKRGWKHKAGDREQHPAGGAQWSNDTDYRLGEAKPYTSAGEKPFTDEEKIRLLFDRGDKKGLRKMQSMIPGNLADHISWSNIESSIAALDRMPQ